MIITLSELKNYLWITDNSQDTILQILVDSVNQIIINILWDITLWEKTENIDICDLQRTCSGLSVLLSNINVQTIDKINWQTYSWNKDIDYFIRNPNNRKVVFKNLDGFGNNNDCSVDITYTSWYVNIPNDIKLAWYIMAWWLFAQKNWQNVKSYKVWDVTVVFQDDWQSLWNMQYTQVNNIFAQYKTFTL